MDGDGKPETLAWIYVCTLKDLLLLSPVQVVAAVHSPDHLPVHHFDIPADDASPAVQLEREEHNEELDRMDAAQKCACDPLLLCGGE